MILALVVFGLSNIYAFDFGSKNVRIAKQIPGKPVSIMQNDQSSRATPNYLSFDSEANSTNMSNVDWYVGLDAERIYRKNKTHGVRNPFKYLNNPQDFPLKGLTAIEAASIAFTSHLRKFNRKHDKLVIAVPSVYTPQARKNLVRSLNLLKVSSMQIVNSNTAVASLYSVEKLPKDKNLSKVMFIDIGAVQTEISYWKFNKTGQNLDLELEHFRASEEIGGDLIDDVLIKDTIKKLPREPAPSEINAIKQAVIRAKERLAAGSDPFIDLTEDFGIRIPLSNNVVNELIPEMLEKLKNILVGIEPPDEIELIGGSTRLPAFVSVIQEAFPNNTLKRSMNSDEAVAIGAAYFAGLQMGIISGPRINVIRPTLYGLDLVVGDKVTHVYEAGDKINRKYTSIRKFTDFNFTIHISKNDTAVPYVNAGFLESSDLSYTSITGLKSLTRNITSKIVKGTIPSLRFTFGVSQTLDCVDFISAALSATISVNMTINGTETFDNSTTSWQLNTHTEMCNQFQEFNYTSSRLLLDGVRQHRVAKVKHAQALHEIESFIMDYIDKATYDSDFELVTTQEERNEVLQILTRERQAVELSGERVTAEALEERLNSLKTKLSEVLQKLSEFQGRPRAFKKIEATIAKAKNAIETAVCGPEVLESFTEYLNETEKFIADAKSQDPHELPHITVKDIEARDARLARKIPELRRKPKTNSEGSTNDKGVSETMKEIVIDLDQEANSNATEADERNDL